MQYNINDVLNITFQFVTSNFVAIISIAITLIGIVITPYYIRGRISSAQKERYNQAKNSLLDILEEQIINKKEMSEERLGNLTLAMERRHSVSISDRISKVEILQDLQLRIEESKLDVDDKEEYSGIIEEKISQIKSRNDDVSIPPEYDYIIEELENTDNITEEKLVEKVEEVRRKPKASISISAYEMMRFLILRDDYHLSPERQRRIRVMFVLVTSIYVVAIYLIIFRGA